MTFLTTANQLHRQKFYQGGQDSRDKPDTLFRVKVDGVPVAQVTAPSPARGAVK